MKKAGILTHYYNSTNYGGVLQAYALCRRLREAGVDAEQVCYDPTAVKRSAVKKVLHAGKKCMLSLKRGVHVRASRMIGTRKKAFEDFRNAVPHSSTVYTEATLDRANDVYDAFITGSDQVWHPGLFKRGYSLSFSKKPKYSYAASMAVERIDAEVKKKYERALLDYSAISVRERNAMSMLDFRNDVKLILDPVFLYSGKEWAKLSGKRIVEEKYVFTYFLGDSASARAQAREFAARKGLKLVNVPYLLNSYRKCDRSFGDVRISDVSPEDFLSLILNAEYVLTDSFHVICFSFLFKKNFYVFRRNSANNMNSRISDVLYTLGLEDRYVEKIGDEKDIDYDKPNAAFEELKAQTERFFEEMVESINK